MSEGGQEITIRVAVPGDAAKIAELNGQLGYPATAGEIRERLEALGAQSAVRTVLVACAGDEVVGWVDVALSFHLQSPECALIGGLVVKDGMRGLGIGKRLCEAAEAWSREKGVSRMRVTSRSTRTDAHRFYLRDGYAEVKTSRVFEKVLS